MKVYVLMGGVSEERDVSLSSGEEVVKYLDKEKYDVKKVIINSKEEVFEKVKGADFVFLALHGKFGEDGTIQAILDSLNIPYSGPKAFSSSLCMNKNISKIIALNKNVLTAPFYIVKDPLNIDYKKIEKIGYPVFIKPNSGGSSIKTFKINKKEEVLNAVLEVFKIDNEVMIEKYIKGKEVSSFVLNGEVFPTITIKTKTSEFFDYESKYLENGAEEVYEEIEGLLQEKINDYSKILWDALSLKGYCRIDMIINDNKVYFLEVNTLPGLTKKSIIPKSAKVLGIGFSELLDLMIKYS